jgi:Transposase DDE domain group 1
LPGCEHGEADCLDSSDRVVLDMDSSESPVHGEQEGSGYNRHFESVCYHPLFLFNSHGDCLAAKLRPGNVHSAEDWDELLLPEIERQQAEADLAFVQQDKADGPGLVRCYAQKEPARTLPNLQKVPILVLTSEASYHAPYDHCTVKYLEQAGVHPTFIRLADLGIHGNSHVMMMEKNNAQIAGVIARWLDKALPPTKPARIEGAN